MKRALQIILGISLFGVVFSGALSYEELFGAASARCPSPGAPGTVLGYPACVYGFFMYLLLSALSSWGLFTAARQRGEPPEIDVRPRGPIVPHPPASRA